jgi:hypothetical protein
MRNMHNSVSTSHPIYMQLRRYYGLELNPEKEETVYEMVNQISKINTSVAEHIYLVVVLDNTYYNDIRQNPVDQTEKEEHFIITCVVSRS